MPEGCTIDKAGIIAAVIRDGEDSSSLGFKDSDVLDFSNANYVKEWKGSPSSMIYTWTKTRLESGDKLYIHPYVTYDTASEKITVIGNRVEYVIN